MKILVVATQLPPYIGSGNIRALNYINYLSRLGHQLDVIGVDYPKDSIAYDKSLEDSFDEGVNIVRVKPGYPYKFFYRKKNNSSNEGSANASINASIKGRLNSFIKNNFVIPDQYLFWIIPAFKQAKKMSAERKYDLLFTLHETPSSHLVGYLLKRKLPHIKWVGYWSDPWNGDSLRNDRSSFKRIIEEFIEKKLINNVDKLLFTTEKTTQLYKNKFQISDDKVSIIYRGYDEELYNDAAKDNIKLKWLKSEKINIIHLGTIYHSLRDISPLSDALDYLKKKNNILYNKLNILFIGQFDSLDDQNKLDSHDIIKNIPLISYEEALKYTVNADVLLLYGNKKSNQIPGKVYEYLGSNAVVLTLYGDIDDELIKFMEMANKGPIIENNSREIYEKINEIVDNILRNQVNEMWTRPIEKFQWKNVVKDLETKLLN